MSRRQQVLAGGLGLIVLVFGVLLIVNQNNQDKPQVLGEQITSTTFGVPGLDQTTTTTQTPATTPTTVASSTANKAVVVTPTTVRIVPVRRTQPTTVTQVVPKQLPMPPLGPATLSSDNSVAVALDATGVDTITSSQQVNKNVYETFGIAAGSSNTNVVTLSATLTNTSGAKFVFGSSPAIDFLLTTGGNTTTVSASLGSTTTLSSYSKITVSVVVALQPSSTYAIGARATGSWAN